MICPHDSCSVFPWKSEFFGMCPLPCAFMNTEKCQWNLTVRSYPGSVNPLPLQLRIKSM